MAVWKCEKWGHEKEGRCKPRKCPECSEAGSFKPVYVEGTVLEISADEKKDVSEILTMAIKNEKSAGEAYTKLAGEIDDPQGAAMFKRLAAEEADHARILEDQFYDINNKGMWTWDA